MKIKMLRRVAYLLRKHLKCWNKLSFSLVTLYAGDERASSPPIGYAPFVSHTIMERRASQKPN